MEWVPIYASPKYIKPQLFYFTRNELIAWEKSLSTSPLLVVNKFSTLGNYARLLLDNTYTDTVRSDRGTEEINLLDSNVYFGAKVNMLPGTSGKLAAMQSLASVIF